MSGAKRFLAYDLGASSGRAIVGLLKDGKLSIEELHRFSNGPTTVLGTMYWDVLKLFEEMRHALLLYSQKYGTELHGIGFDTWGVDFGLLDKDGALIGNPVHYRDSRTDGLVEEACKRVGKDYIFEKTGIQFLQLNTLYQLFAMALHDSPLFKTAETLLTMPSLFTYFFTGKKVNEYTHITTTQIYDPRAQDWAYDLLKQLNIPTDILHAEIVTPGTIVGDLLPELADLAGLNKVPVIAVGSHDTASAVASVPAKGDDWAYLSSGTWSLLGLEVPEPIINEESLRHNVTNEGGVAGTIRFLKNIVGLWLIQECRRMWVQEGTSLGFGELMQEAEQATPFKAFIDPDDDSFLHPQNMPQAICDFCRKTGQAVPETRGEIIRCAVESLALKYRDVLDTMEQLRGKPVKVLHLVGGGIQNTLLSQLTANATGKTVIAGPVEATAIGNIMVQALATGDIASIEEGREIIRQSYDTVTYEPQDPEGWQEAYRRYQQYV